MLMPACELMLCDLKQNFLEMSGNKGTVCPTGGCDGGPISEEEGLGFGAPGRGTDPVSLVTAAKAGAGPRGGQALEWLLPAPVLTYGMQEGQGSWGQERKE